MHKNTTCPVCGYNSGGWFALSSQPFCPLCGIPLLGVSRIATDISIGDGATIIPLREVCTYFIVDFSRLKPGGLAISTFKAGELWLRMPSDLMQPLATPQVATKTPVPSPEEFAHILKDGPAPTPAENLALLLEEIYPSDKEKKSPIKAVDPKDALLTDAEVENFTQKLAESKEPHELKTDTAADEKVPHKGRIRINPSPRPMRRSLLQEAEELINGARADDYGDATDSFAHIANLWGAYLGQPVRPADVAVCMVLLKISRLKHSGYSHHDSFVDAAGYIALAERVAK